MDPRRETKRETTHTREVLLTRSRGVAPFPGPIYDVRPRPNTDNEPTAAVRDYIRASSSIRFTTKMKIK